MDVDLLFLALWMGFAGAIVMLIGALLFFKALQGDIAFTEAAITFVPVALFYGLFYAARGTFFSWVFGFAGLGYLVSITVWQHVLEKRMQRELHQRELEKWSRAVAEDDLNSGAHLFLGNALVQQGDFDGAAAHYRRALELDASNAFSLCLFLLQRRGREEREIRSRLPELNEIARKARSRSTRSQPARSDAGAGEVGTARLTEEPGKPEGESARQALFGYSSDGERAADQGLHARIAELRLVMERCPDDISIRIQYAKLLEDAGHPDLAREEYARALAMDPQNREAAAAIVRLETAPAPDEDGKQLPTPELGEIQSERESDAAPPNIGVVEQES